MIGVLADSSKHDIVREFFELFKTPWEFYRAEQRYDVLLCADGSQASAAARIVLVYAARQTEFDDAQKTTIGRQRKDPCIVSYEGNQLPLYGESLSFPERTGGFLEDAASRECLAFRYHAGDRVLVRLGYDLLEEVRTLLTVGQPPANAAFPALELHIALLRDLIVASGIALLEIPPVPEGFSFIACLSHDVDHPSIRAHKWDHTSFGFLFRATFGSLRRLVLGQMPLRDLLVNWAAVVKLPLVYLGLAKDFWREFDSRYLELEQGLHSTFFVIPFKNRPGKNSPGPAPSFRASGYEAREIADIIRSLVSAGNEVALHGIDAWIDSSRGREELEEIRRLTGAAQIGVRMHWLYYDQNSPNLLEAAGASYDSTMGYNETVGYRAGATQVYKPLTANQLLELPLHVMDTALFYPSRLGLDQQRATGVLSKMFDNAVRFGGVLTINWHDRSLAPERLWDGCYRSSLAEMKSRGAWFSTAEQAVSWFRKRRSAKFAMDETGVAAQVKIAAGRREDLPELRLRTYKPSAGQSVVDGHCFDYVDAPIAEDVEGMFPRVQIHE
jgi:hypothetical protein